MDIIHYLSETGKDPFQAWMDRLLDVKARAAILRRVDRLAGGNPGDYKFLRDGVHELRIDIGPGYRVYFAMESRAVTVLLCGGTKGTQVADMDRAVKYLADYKRRG